MIIAVFLVSIGVYIGRDIDLSSWGFLIQWQYWVTWVFLASGLLVAYYEGKKSN